MFELPEQQSTSIMQLIHCFCHGQAGQAFGICWIRGHHKNSNVLKKISSLHESYKKLLKNPVLRRQAESFKKKEDEFTNRINKYTLKRSCTPKTVGTTVEISKDFTKKLGPAADRLELSNSVLTSVIDALSNHGGCDIPHLSLSKSTARRHRALARSEQAASIRRDFTCNFSHINYDGRLLSDDKNSCLILEDFCPGSKEEIKILAITKTSDTQQRK